MHVIGFRALCLFVICCLPASAHAAGAIERIGPGTIDWNNGVVTATGVGVAAPNLMPTQAKAMAHRAAIAVGYRNLLETLKGVAIDSETTVENYIQTNDVIKAKVSGIIQGAKILDTKVTEDGNVEIQIGVSLRGELANVFIPQSFGKFSTIAYSEDKAHPIPQRVPPSQKELSIHSHTPKAKALPSLRQDSKMVDIMQPLDFPPTESPAAESIQPSEPLRKDPPTVELIQPAQPLRNDSPPEEPYQQTQPFRNVQPIVGSIRPDANAPLPYTGLIVDGTGLGLKPALMPKIVDEKGNEFYASKVITRQKAVDEGIVGYSKDLIAASRQARVTNTPLIVKGLRAKGSKKTDIVISDSTLQTIQEAENTHGFLQQARVVIVYD